MIPPLDKVHNGEQPANQLISSGHAHNQIHRSHLHDVIRFASQRLCNPANCARLDIFTPTNTSERLRAGSASQISKRHTPAGKHHVKLANIDFHRITPSNIYNHFGCSIKMILPNRLFVNHVIKKIFQNGCFSFSNRVIYNRGDSHVDNRRAYKKSS